MVGEKQLSCWKASGQELGGSGWVEVPGNGPAGDTTLISRGLPQPHHHHECEPLGRTGGSVLTPESW